MTRNRVLHLALAIAVSSPAAGFAQPSPPRPTATVNQPAPAFTVTDIKGKTHSLDSYLGKWVVLEWFNHECPYTRKHYYTNNMQNLQREYTAKGVVWMSVVSSAPGTQGWLASAADADRVTMEKKAAPSFVVRDTAGTLGRLYDARTTPHLYVIDPRGVLRYAGAIDSKPSPVPRDVVTAHNYLKAALDSGLAGRPIAPAVTQPYGCEVKY